MIQTKSLVKKRGPGRPRNLAKAVALAERDQQELAVALRRGFGDIAAAMPDIIQAALKLAVGFETTTRDGKPRIVPPDVKMIKVLLDIAMEAMLTQNLDDPENKNSAAGLLRKALEDGNSGKAEIHLHQHIERPPDPLGLFNPDSHIRGDVRVGHSGGNGDDEPPSV